MPDDTITIVSSTDSPEAVQAALTGTPEKPAEAKVETPAPPVTTPTGQADPTVTPPVEEPLAGETPEQTAARVSSADKRKNKIQAQIDELWLKKNNARRDVEAEEARLATLRKEREQLEAAATPKVETPAAPAPTGKPKLDDTAADGKPLYANYEEWVDAVAAFHAAATDKKIAEAETKLTERATRERIEREQADRADTDYLAHHRRIEEFKESHADFDAVLASAADTVREIKEDLGPNAFAVIDQYTVVDADNGVAIIHYLAQHPEEMERITKLSAPLQLAALGKLDARLDAAKPGPSSTAVPVTTKAPEPIKPVGSSPTASTVSPENETYTEYRARREREEKAVRR